MHHLPLEYSKCYIQVRISAAIAFYRICVVGDGPRRHGGEDGILPGRV